MVILDNRIICCESWTPTFTIGVVVVFCWIFTVDTTLIKTCRTSQEVYTAKHHKTTSIYDGKCCIWHSSQWHLNQAEARAAGLHLAIGITVDIGMLPERVVDWVGTRQIVYRVYFWLMVCSSRTISRHICNFLWYHATDYDIQTKHQNLNREYELWASNIYLLK